MYTASSLKSNANWRPSWMMGSYPSLTRSRRRPAPASPQPKPANTSCLCIQVPGANAHHRRIRPPSGAQSQKGGGQVKENSSREIPPFSKITHPWGNALQPHGGASGGHTAQRMAHALPTPIYGGSAANCPTPTQHIKSRHIAHELHAQRPPDTWGNPHIWGLVAENGRNGAENRQLAFANTY